jgi:hypothetical protein
MLKRLAVLSVLAIGYAAVAHATPVSGSFSIGGLDGFTSSTITFGAAAVGGTPLGTFSFLTGGLSGNPVTMFPTFPGTPLPFAPGSQTVMSRLGVPNVLALTTTQSGITVDFYLTDYTTTYDTTGHNSCLVAECLTVSGDGFFTETGYTNSPGVFSFTTQETADDMSSGLMTPTTFSASGVAASTPEPSSLLLLGTGILGLAGIARGKMIKA